MQLPSLFVERTQKLLGNDYPLFEQSLSEAPSVSIRANNKLAWQPSGQQVKWHPDGYYLSERPLFTADPLFHAGVYYVQEASSMFLYQATKQYFPTARNVLDVCAAPGGKSTLLSQLLPADSILVSNEIVRSRAQVLAENMVKWGNQHTVVCNNIPADFKKLPAFFDAIVVDAPCSGEGMFRKDEGAIREWSIDNVRLCVERQRSILTDVWTALKADGILVYSTCTFNREENEENMQWMCEELGAELLTLDVTDFPEIVVSDAGYRFYPHRTRGEGFFLSVVRKTKGEHTARKKTSNPKKGIRFVNKRDVPFSLTETNEWRFVLDGTFLSAYNAERSDDFLRLKETLNCFESGILLAEQKGRDFIPSVNLALSKHLNVEETNRVEVDVVTAIAYLKKEAIYLNDAPRGFVLLTHKNVPIGWVKNVGNRCNNLYPPQWRIRMNIS